MTIVIQVARDLDERAGRYLRLESMGRICVDLNNAQGVHGVSSAEQASDLLSIKLFGRMSVHC